MTTKVTISANHSWPVDVTPLARGMVQIADRVRVVPGEVRDFHVYAGQDLFIHEVQPAEAMPLSPTGLRQKFEEEVNAILEKYKSLEGVDGRWLAIARTDIEKGFLALERALRSSES